MVPDTQIASNAAATDAGAQAVTAPAAQNADANVASRAQTLDALGPIAPFVLPMLLLILVGLAIFSWVAARARRAEQDELLAQANDMKQNFWSAGSLRQGMQSLDQGSPFRYIAELSLNAAENNNDKLYAKISRRAWVGQVIQHAKDFAVGLAEQGPASLIPIAAGAVVIGLLGAGWAVLVAPAIAATPLDALAIGEGAAMLIFGAAIGIAAMASYNKLLARNDPCVYQIRAFSSDLQKALLTPAEPPAMDRLLARAGAR